jgi:hypothetical protein
MLTVADWEGIARTINALIEDFMATWPSGADAIMPLKDDDEVWIDRAVYAKERDKVLSKLAAHIALTVANPDRDRSQVLEDFRAETEEARVVADQVILESQRKFEPPPGT